MRDVIFECPLLYGVDVHVKLCAHPYSNIYCYCCSNTYNFECSIFVSHMNPDFLGSFVGVAGGWGQIALSVIGVRGRLLTLLNKKKSCLVFIVFILNLT